MPKLSVGNQMLFYAQTGEVGAGEVVLLLVHGAGSSHLDWPPELRRLGDTAVFALDLPGHGHAPPPGRESIEAYAEVVHQFVQVVGLTRVVLLGHSMGGAIAQKVGADNPAWLAGLVLVGTAAQLPVSPAILAQISSDYGAVVSFLERYQWSPEAPEELRALSRERLLGNDTAVVLSDFTACNHFDGRPLLGQIRVPTLIIGGTKDKMTPFAGSEALAQGIAGSRLLALTGAGHFMTLERGEEVATAVGEFLLSL
jgi:pimeloyl-ACP methyl ester carboxylesterase